MSAVDTYDLVTQMLVHAYPNRSPYPNPFSEENEIAFFIPVDKGGKMEYVFKVFYCMVCNPNEVDNLKPEPESGRTLHYNMLFAYHKERMKYYGYQDCDYVFLFFIPVCYIRQPFNHNIRNTKYFSIEEVPVIGMKKTLDPIKSERAWIFSYNSKFDVDDAMHMLPGIDWDVSHTVTRGKIRENDVVYLYSSRPEQAIKYRCKVIKANKKQSTIDDSMFGGNPAGNLGDWAELELECEYKEPGIEYKYLLEHGLKNGSLSKRNVNNASLVRFLQEYDADVDNIYCPFDEIGYENDVEDNPADLAESIDESINTLSVKGEDREAVVRQRVNQGIFRDRLLENNNKCVLCNVDDEHLLIASHIKPWSESEPGEKLDPDNGFLMCPNHDKLFDGGYISFDDEGKIMISPELSDVNRMFMNVNVNMKIDLSEGNKRYLLYHRNKKYRY